MQLMLRDVAGIEKFPYQPIFLSLLGLQPLASVCLYLLMQAYLSNCQDCWLHAGIHLPFTCLEGTSVGTLNVKYLSPVFYLGPIQALLTSPYRILPLLAFSPNL